MPNWRTFFSREVIIMLALVLVLASLSAATLVTIPRIFFDEATAIEVARNFQLFGVPDILTAPGHFSGFPYITGSTGYPVTLPLAVIFDVFGFGFTQARIYALLWLIAFFVTAWVFVRRFWNDSYATAALALLIGFASLHDSGHRVMGDVPGFMLMLLGLLFLFKKNRPYSAGLFFGLAVAAKPSVYLLILPALILTYIIEDWRRAFRKLLPVGIGTALPLAAWILLQFPQPFHLDTWRHVISFYQNAFGSSYSPWTSIVHNLKSFASQTTLIYFSILAVPTIFAFREKLAKRDPLTIFLLLYGIFDTAYFLKSTGTIRYLLPLELFILLLLPYTIAWTLQTVRARSPIFGAHALKYAFHAIVVGFGIFHIVQLFFFSSVLAKNTANLQALEFLKRYTTETIGIVSSPHIAAFISPEQKLHYVRETDQIIFGTNPLNMSRETLPDILVIPSGYEEGVPFTEAEQRNLRRYTIIFEGRWNIYALRP